MSHNLGNIVFEGQTLLQKCRFLFNEQWFELGVREYPVNAARPKD
jgi:hypothetical protein